MVKGSLWVRRGVMCAAALVGLAASAGCAGSRSVPVSISEADSADSNATREDALLDGGGLDGAQTTDLDDASDDMPVVEPRARRSVGGGFDVQAVTGFRSDARFRWESPWGLSAGARVCGGVSSGFVRFEGRGILRTVHVGRVALRGAERLILGRGLGSFAIAGGGSVRGGFAARPSFSKWYAFPGMAVALGWNGWRVDAAAIGSAGGERAMSPAVWWTSVSKEFERGMAGVTLGMPASVSPPGTSDASSAAAVSEDPRVVSVFASYHLRGFRSSGEIAVTSGRTFVALRVSGREQEKSGRSARAHWSVLYFDAPQRSPLGEAGLERVGRTDRGTRLDVTRSLGPVRLAALIAAGRTRSESRQTAYRRLALVLSETRPPPLWWEASVLYKDGSTEDYPSSPVEVVITEERQRDLRLRVAAGIRGGETVGWSVRADYLPANGGSESGVVLVLSTELTAGRLNARLQTAAHSLPPGRSAAVWRPGAVPFEWLAPLYGKGSDVALRAVFRATRGARIFLFYGSSFYGSSRSGRNRAYAGFEYRR